MPHHPPRTEDLFLTRRELLQRGGLGFGMLGLAGLVAAASGAGAPGSPVNPLAQRRPHFRPQALLGQQSGLRHEIAEGHGSEEPECILEPVAETEHRSGRARHHRFRHDFEPAGCTIGLTSGTC